MIVAPACGVNEGLVDYFLVMTDRRSGQFVAEVTLRFDPTFIGPKEAVRLVRSHLPESMKMWGGYEGLEDFIEKQL